MNRVQSPATGQPAVLGTRIDSQSWELVMVSRQVIPHNTLAVVFFALAIVSQARGAPGETLMPEAPAWVRRFVPDPGSPESHRFAESQRTRLAAERELKKIRAKHFRATKNVEIRQVGFGRIRSFVDPSIFPSLLTIFDTEDRDVRSVVFDHLADQRTDEGDSTLAWEAVFGPDDWGRQVASHRIQARVRQAGNISDRIHTILNDSQRS